MLLGSALLMAVCVDLCFGEPPRFHPLVGFGRLASALERFLNRFTVPWLSRISGSLAWLLLILPPLVVGMLLLQLPNGWLWLFSVLALYFAMAYHSLRQHILAIYRPLKRSDITSARRALAMIVSRDTSRLDAQGVRKAAIESCLENGADGVLAPVFWFIVLGPVAAVVYRLVNTLDAMWGYKHARFLHFGWCAARMDDLVNWLPARLVAISYCLLGDTQAGVHAWRSQAPLWESPNAGPVMAAGAGALGVVLGGAAVYQGRNIDKPRLGAGKPPCDDDLLRALRLVRNTLILWVVSGMLLLTVAATVWGMI